MKIYLNWLSIIIGSLVVSNYAVAEVPTSKDTGKEVTEVIKEEESVTTETNIPEGENSTVTSSSEEETTDLFTECTAVDSNKNQDNSNIQEADNSNIEETESSSTSETPTEETESSSTSETSTEETESSSTSETSTEETESSSTSETSTEETESSSTSETPTEETESSSTSETSTEETESSSTSETSTEETESSSTSETSTEETESSSTSETPTEETESSSTSETPTEETESSSTSETPTEETESSSTSETSTEETESSSTSETSTEETESSSTSETSTEETESSSTSETPTEETESFQDCLTAEEIANYQKLIAADNLYLQGEQLAAVQLYQEVKKPWETEKNNENILPIANHDSAKLSPGGAVYWRTYQQGKEQQLKSKIFTPLQLLVTREPQFIPGHIQYATELLADQQENQALEVLENAVGLYPNDIQLLRFKIATDVQTERWLEASISARQFALFNSEIPEAAEFTRLADEYLESYSSHVREELTWNAVGNAITGVAGFALTGNLFGPISAIDTTIMLLQGESQLGDRFSRRAQKQLPMVEDEKILNYVRNIGKKIAAVAGRDEFEYEFFVVMDDNINAFALPGGKVFVNLGAIMKTNSEAELAGLLAHEVAHSVLSHGFQLATRGSLTANVTQYIPYVGGTAGNLIVLNYSRDMERQADVFGTRILVAADYAADGVRNLMAKLQEIEKEEEEENNEPPAWLSTHPNTQQRIDYMEYLIISNNLNRYAYEGIEQHYKIKKLANKIWQEYEKEEAEKEKD